MGQYKTPGVYIVEKMHFRIQSSKSQQQYRLLSATQNVRITKANRY